MQIKVKKKKRKKENGTVDITAIKRRTRHYLYLQETCLSGKLHRQRRLTDYSPWGHRVGRD